MIRACIIVLALFGVAACHPVTEVRGIYVAQGKSGTFFPCSEPNTAVIVPDSVLASRYQQLGDHDQGAYVHLRGVSTKGGSIYDGRRYFVVQQILELRARAAGECPQVARPFAATLP
jgi:hypothetical protein